MRGNMKLSQREMEEVVDYLQGTCMSIDEALYILLNTSQNDLENELEFCEYIDNRIFECVQCGWWYEAGEWTEYDNVPESSRGQGEFCSSCGQENGWSE